MFALRLNVAGGFLAGGSWFKTWYSKFIPVHKDVKSWELQFQCHCGISVFLFPWTSSCASCWCLHIHSKCHHILGIVTSNLQVDQAGWDIPVRSFKLRVDVHVKLNAYGRIIHSTWIAPCECNPLSQPSLIYLEMYHITTTFVFFLKKKCQQKWKGFPSRCKTLGVRVQIISKYESVLDELIP